MTQSTIERRFQRQAAAANQKAQKLGTPGRLTSRDLYFAFVASEGICCYCDIDLDPEHCSFDHVIPFDKNGPNTPDNIVACCASCNRDKHTKNPAQLAEWRELSVTCPIDQRVFRPRWADWVRGYGRYCSRICAGKAGAAKAHGEAVAT